MAFNLRSGNKSSFKNIGSSPAKETPPKDAFSAKKKWYVDNYEENKDKPGYQEAMNKAFGGETTMDGMISTTIKKTPAKQIELALLRKRKGLGPREIKGEDDQSYEAAVTRKEMGMTKEYPYYYKINGQNVSKEAYKKYENKPGGDEPGKQTNDPDVYGRKANNHGRGPKTK